MNLTMGAKVDVAHVISAADFRHTETIAHEVDGIYLASTKR